MELQQIEEYRLTDPLREQIASLLRICFPDFPANQSFLHQAPGFRFLLWEEQTLVGHLAVDHRHIRVGTQFFYIFGVVDFCIHPQVQDRGFGKYLLDALDNLARQNSIDFLVLLASEHSLYLQQGFRCVSNPCRWLMIQHGHSLGINQRKLPDSVLIKPVGEQLWPDGVLDFLGHIF